MTPTGPIDLHLSLQDATASGEELQQILRTLAAELENQTAVVTPGGQPPPPEPGTIAKGEASSGILDIKINLDALKGFAQWLYERLVGTSTKATFEYQGAKFVFEGRNEADRAAAMQDFERFMATIAAAQGTKQ